MFIKDGVYRSVDVSGLTAPIAEGTIMTAAGAIAAADGSDAYGIVPENVYVMPPTKIINVAVGGIIDLLDPANANVTLSEAVMTKLGEDFNFVQFNEHTGGEALPTYDDNDIGKVLTVVPEYEAGAEAIPAQTVTVAQGVGTIQNANVSQWTEGQRASVTYNGTTYTGQIVDAEGALVFITDDFTLSYDSTTGVLQLEDIEHSGDNTISARYVTEHANADWAEPSGGSGETGNFVRVYNMNEILRNSIDVVSDIDGTVVEYTSGELIVALDYENIEISCRLADTTLLNTPIVVIDDEEGFKTVLSTNVMFNNDGDINKFVPPENANAEPIFYVKEISPNAKCLVLVDGDRSYILRVIDANSVTIGYGYIKKTN